VTTTAPSDSSAKADGRRELGERTRARILEVASELLAQRGEDAIRLRDITDAAQVNVAAVNYHFGSLKALYIAATREAVQTIITEALGQLSELGGDASLEEIVTAWVRPLLAARSGPTCGQRQAFLRITARAIGDPSGELCDWLTETRSHYHRQLAAQLRGVLAELPPAQLQFRVCCAAGILDALNSTHMQIELQDVDTDELERWLVPVIAGALSGPYAPARTPPLTA
jgi:AcrR family transcriptional regulator